ncbi:MAG TPA: anti-sigma F factor, partial [Pseudomonas sp.]|nr:anti-sigma F factor [Pseudomonas sp.]
MKTDELINMLANHAPPVDRQIVARRFGTALVIGLVLALLL